MIGVDADHLNICDEQKKNEIILNHDDHEDMVRLLNDKQMKQFIW